MLWAISGGAGFLGLHLARRLLADGHEVRTLDVAPLDDAELERAVEELRGDVRAAAGAASSSRAPTWSSTPPRRCRSRARARRSVGEHRGHRDDARRRARGGRRRVVFISSTAVYGVPKVHPIDEDAPLVGVGQYGASKIEAERSAREFARAGSRS